MKMQKIMMGLFLSLAFALLAVCTGMVTQREMATRQLEQAIARGDGIELYTLYSDAEDDLFIRRRQDAVIARTIDSIHMDLEMQGIEGYEACRIWMSQWGGPLDEDGLCLGDCLSDENVERWNELMDDIAALKLRGAMDGIGIQSM